MSLNADTHWQMDDSAMGSISALVGGAKDGLPEEAPGPRLPSPLSESKPTVDWADEEVGVWEDITESEDSPSTSRNDRHYSNDEPGVVTRVWCSWCGTLSSWRLCLRKLWLLDDVRGTLLCTFLLLFVQTAGAAYTLANPCLVSADMFSEECALPRKALMGLQIATVGVMTVIVNAELWPKISAAQRQQLGKRSDHRHGQVSGWAAASSKTVFDEIVKVTRQGQAQLMMFVAVFNVVMSAAFAVGDIAVWSSEEYLAFRAATCGEDAAWWQPCAVAWMFKDVIAVLVSTSNIYFSGLLFGIRTEMWSSIFDVALTKTNTRWLFRCMRVHWITLPFAVSMVYVFAIGVKIKLLAASAAEMTAFAYISVLHITCFTLCVAWSLDLDGLLCRNIRRLLRRLPGLQRLTSRASIFPDIPLMDASDFWPCSSETATDSRKASGSSRSVGFWAYLRGTRGGFKYRQMQLLVNNILLMLVQPLGSPWSIGLVWAFRLLTILMLLSTHDSPSTFADLNPAEASFGLLVDAGDLKAALAAFHRGEKYTGPLVMTRASYYRMDDTLAVSYRWQNQETRVCQGLSLNMTAWQLRELERAVDTAGCLYVWLDRIALPQHTCGLQVTLLARMMAIFAVVRKTLALRGLEAEGSRYHQRAWILQEYCNARELIVVTEPGAESNAESGVSAVAGDEESFFPSIREWHQARGESCSPYWLYGLRGGAVKDNIRNAMDKFKNLSDKLVCTYEVDKVRALYPLLFNTPCENHVELQQLVRDVVLVANEVMHSPSGKTHRRFLAQVAESERVLVHALAATETLSIRDILEKGAMHMAATVAWPPDLPGSIASTSGTRLNE